MKMYDIVIIGNYTKDTIVSPTGTRSVDGGGFNYGAYVASLMDMKTAAVTQLSRDDKHVVEALQKIGVDVYPKFTQHSTDMRLYYPTTNVDERILSVTHTAGPFTPEQVRDLQSKAFLINSSTRGEVDLDVIQELKKKNTIIAADSQGFVRIIAEDGTLKYDYWDEKAKILPYIDFLKTDAVEAEIMTNEPDIKTAARILADHGPKEIVLTHRNGLLVFANDQYYETEFHPRELIGRSGRGDTCIASYTAKRLTANPEKSTIWAAAVTSLKMEAEGPILRTKEDVEKLIQNKYQK